KRTTSTSTTVTSSKSRMTSGLQLPICFVISSRCSDRARPLRRILVRSLSELRSIFNIRHLSSYVGAKEGPSPTHRIHIICDLPYDDADQKILIYQKRMRRECWGG